MSKADTTPVTLLTSDVSEMSKVEKLKSNSEGLFFVASKEKQSFGAIIDDLAAGDAETISNDAKEISKHFGIYKQQERVAGRKSGDYIFMARLKMPAGGELSASQWLAMEDISKRYANGTLRLTTRQAIQFHYISGRNLGALIRATNEVAKDGNYGTGSLGACGDVNRNTMCSPVEDLDPELPLNSRELAYRIADELAPRSSAYAQIFLSDDAGRTVAPMQSEEPIYGKHYLPRKFKIGIAHPNDGSVDLLTQDIGFLPVLNGAVAEEYDLYTGGGLGTTHNMPKTKALLGIYMGRIPKAQVVETSRAIAILQKENGERKDRRQARWKYTIRRLGHEWVREQLRQRFSIQLKDADPQPLPKNRFFHGWNKERADGDQYFLGLPIPSGRVQDKGTRRELSAIRMIVTELKPGLRVTGNQDLLITHIPADKREWVEATLREHGVPLPDEVSLVRKQAFGCPALPTCGLAMTEAEGVIPVYAKALEDAGLGDVDVVIRMAGCPNSCSRPPTAEIGITGFGKNTHMIQVGSSRECSRIGKLLYSKIPEDQMIPVLTGLVRAIRDQNPNGLPAGEFLHETSVEQLRDWVGYEETA